MPFLNFLAFAAALVFAVPSWADSSFVCPNQLESAQGVHCCSDSQTTYSCKDVVKELPFYVHQRVQEIKSLYSQGSFGFGSAPNCHWNSFYYYHSQVEGYQPLSPYELQRFLIKNFDPLPHGTSLRPGDLIYFIFRSNGPGFVRVSYDSLVETGFFDHSAVYLGNGLVFQKENTFNDVFSIAPLSLTLKRYEEEILKTSNRRGSLRWQAWRLR